MLETATVRALEGVQCEAILPQQVMQIIAEWGSLVNCRDKGSILDVDLPIHKDEDVNITLGLFCPLYVYGDSLSGIL